MDKWANEVAGEAVGILVFVLVATFFVLGAFVVGGIWALAVQGLQYLEQGQEAPLLAPSSEPEAVPASGRNGGLWMGEAITWQ